MGIFEFILIHTGLTDCRSFGRLLVRLLSITGPAKVGRNQIPTLHCPRGGWWIRIHCYCNGHVSQLSLLPCYLSSLILVSFWPISIQSMQCDVKVTYGPIQYVIYFSRMLLVLSTVQLLDEIPFMKPSLSDREKRMRLARTRGRTWIRVWAESHGAGWGAGKTHLHMFSFYYINRVVLWLVWASRSVILVSSCQCMQELLWTTWCYIAVCSRL